MFCSKDKLLLLVLNLAAWRSKRADTRPHPEDERPSTEQHSESTALHTHPLHERQVRRVTQLCVSVI